MASSKNAQYQAAKEKYDQVSNQYTGQSGYNLGVQAAQANGTQFADQQLGMGTSAGHQIANQASIAGRETGAANTAAANSQARGASQDQNSLVNREAQKYAGQQAANAAAGTQSQATTAARAAGMNKAQAAMMGSQQNANAYQNAYGNAYSQQMGQANSSYENQANRANNNITNATNLNANQMNNATNVYGQNMSQQQGYMTNAGNSAVSAAGTAMGAGQQEGQNEYEREWGNWGAGLGLASMLLPSDERLKHYQECSKKVVIKSPKAIEKLKYVKKEN